MAKNTLQWIYTLPNISGNYVVQTKTPMGKILTLQSNLTFDSKNKPHWSFNNQTFYRYLKQ